MSFDVEIPTGVDGRVANDPTWSPLRCEKLVTFVGGTDDAWGDKDGALASGVIFIVTGTVRVRMIGVVETTLVGAGKVEAGISGDTATLEASIFESTEAS